MSHKRPLTPEEKAEARRQAAARDDPARDFARARAADSGRTPALVLEALLPEGVTIAGHRLAPFRLGDYFLLEKLENPLARMLIGQKADVKLEHIAEAVFLGSRPVAESRELLACGREEFDEAFHAFADELNPGDLLRDSEKFQAWLLQGFSTALPMVEKKTGTPKPSAAAATPDSAGG